jgi:hypothetical protein
MKGATLAYLEQADRDVPRCSSCGAHLTEATVPVDSSWAGNLCARCENKEFNARYEEERNFSDYEDRQADWAEDSLFFEREDRAAFTEAADFLEDFEDDGEGYDWDVDPDFDGPKFDPLLETTLNQTVV